MGCVATDVTPLSAKKLKGECYRSVKLVEDQTHAMERKELKNAVLPIVVLPIKHGPIHTVLIQNVVIKSSLNSHLKL
jgi:hypothetical protein